MIQPEEIHAILLEADWIIYVKQQQNEIWLKPITQEANEWANNWRTKHYESSIHGFRCLTMDETFATLIDLEYIQSAAVSYHISYARSPRVIIRWI